MSTRHYVMIGAPVTAVRTPPLLRDWMACQNVEASIDVRHLEPDDLPSFMDGIRGDSSVAGLLITMPHKRIIMPHLDGLSAVAQRAGGVNAAKRAVSGALIGAQFDGFALVNALLAKQVPLGECRVLLAGVGGAGLAIAQALAAHGVGELAVMERDAALRSQVVLGLRESGTGRVLEITDPSLDLSNARFELLINATPLGMRDGDPAPFAADLTARARWIADIVADPPQTRLAARAREAGTPLITGRDMVLGQVAAIGQWLLGNGVEQ